MVGAFSAGMQDLRVETTTSRTTITDAAVPRDTWITSEHVHVVSSRLTSLLAVGLNKRPSLLQHVACSGACSIANCNIMLRSKR